MELFSLQRETKGLCVSTSTVQTNRELLFALLSHGRILEPDQEGSGSIFLSVRG